MSENELFIVENIILQSSIIYYIGTLNNKRHNSHQGFSLFMLCRWLNGHMAMKISSCVVEEIGFWSMELELKEIGDEVQYRA